MKVLVTGATGLVGRELTQLLRDNNIAVHYLTTREEAIENEADYKGFLWNPKEHKIDEKCLEGVDAIFHLAGASISKPWTDENKRAIISSRVDTTRLLYETLRRNKNGVNQFICASAIGAYPSSMTQEYTEEFPTYNEGFLGEVVKVWESAANELKELQLTVAKVRTGIVLSEKGGALPQITLPIKLYLGAPLGSGQQWQSWIHLEDMAQIYLHIYKNWLSGIFNAAAPHPVTNAELTKDAAKALRKPLLLPAVPQKVLKIAMGDRASIVLESQKVNSNKIQETGYVFKFPQLTPALQDLLA
ncbi:MAG: TIGR01777 family oxidoreductase [Leeuwenhoekiella sp.]